MQGKPQLVTLAAKLLQAVDPADGRPIWWCDGVRGFGSSPLYSSGLVYADGTGDRPALAVDTTGGRHVPMVGDVTKSRVKWLLPEVAGHWASAVSDGEYVYKTDASQTLTCRRLSTGQTVYTKELEGLSPLASPFATADGRIYFVSAGRGYVIKAGPKFEILGGGHVGGWDNGASPAVSGGRSFIRDFDFLYCLGKK